MVKPAYKHLVIRTPESINKDYSDTIIKLGILELEILNIYDAQEKQSKRKNEIITLKEEIVERITELSSEMDASQKEIKRKQDEQKEKEPELPLDVKPERITEVTEVMQ